MFQNASFRVKAFVSISQFHFDKIEDESHFIEHRECQKPEILVKVDMPFL